MLKPANEVTVRHTLDWSQVHLILANEVEFKFTGDALAFVLGRLLSSIDQGAAEWAVSAGIIDAQRHPIRMPTRTATTSGER